MTDAEIKEIEKFITGQSWYVSKSIAVDLLATVKEQREALENIEKRIEVKMHPSSTEMVILEIVRAALAGKGEK